MRCTIMNKQHEEVKEEVVTPEEPVIENDDALDQELEDSINKLKAGKELVENQVKPEEVENPDEAPVKNSDEATMDFKLPLKSKFESDEVYEKRVELMEHIQKKKVAVTEEQKQNLSDKIQGTRNDIRELSISQKKESINNPKEIVEIPEDIDPQTKADLERLKELGGATKEDIQQILQEERDKQSVNNTLEGFVERHPMFKDQDTRDVFFDFVDNNYNWQNKSGKELMTVLELAKENMFKPAEGIQDRVLKSANVAEKVNTMQFPGGTNTQSNIPDGDEAAVAELMAAGMSEKKALELLED